ncbi:MAG: hypothetical protein JJE13_00965 [Thermoleophilia bacterium]|nr:hypothetical protein [Thermoleophilia bacterium]
MGRRSLNILANLDLIALAIALPVFILFDLSIVAYLVAAGMWLLSRLIHAVAERKAKENLLAGKRNTAMGTIAATSLGSAWIMALVVLIAGVISRDVGFYAAILLVIVFTLNLASRGLVHLYKSDLDDQTA